MNIPKVVVSFAMMLKKARLLISVKPNARKEGDGTDLPVVGSMPLPIRLMVS